MGGVRYIQPVDEVQGKKIVCVVNLAGDGLAEDSFAHAGFGTELQAPSRAGLFRRSVQISLHRIHLGKLPTPESEQERGGGSEREPSPRPSENLR